MDNPQPRRRLNLHRSTWVVGGIALCIMSVIVIPGVVDGFTALESSPEYASSGPSTRYLHGWPHLFLIREYPDGEYYGDGPILGVPWMSWNSWKLWQIDDVDEFWIWYLLLDVFVLATIVAIVPAVWEWRRRRRNRLLQFGITDLIALTAFAAVPLGWFAYHRSQEKRELYHAEILQEEFGSAFGSRFSNRTVAPKWLSRLLGEGNCPSFQYAYSVHWSPYFSSKTISQGEALTYLAAFERLRELECEMPVADEALFFRALAKMPSLYHVVLWDNIDFEVLDLELAEQISQLQQIDCLQIHFQSGVTPEARQLLQERMPNCVVKYAYDRQ